MVQQVVINYAAVFVAAIVSMVLGSLWYSPMMFGKVWMKLSGITDKQMKEAKKKGMAKSMTKSYIVAFIGSLVMAYVLAHMIKYAEAGNVADGLQSGFWVWLGFVATVTVGSVTWEGKPFKLWVLNNGHHLLSLVVMGAILAAWP